MSADSRLPAAERRNYKNVLECVVSLTRVLLTCLPLHLLLCLHTLMNHSLARCRAVWRGVCRCCRCCSSSSSCCSSSCSCFSCCSCCSFCSTPAAPAAAAAAAAAAASTAATAATAGGLVPSGACGPGRRRGNPLAGFSPHRHPSLPPELQYPRRVFRVQGLAPHQVSRAQGSQEGWCSHNFEHMRQSFASQLISPAVSQT